jgi:alginate O-acetyltransferase complex protein AlgI
MIFNTWTFALFASVALALYWTVVPARAKRAYLVAAGCVFYASAVPAYLALVVALGAVTFAASRFLLAERGRGTRRAVFIAGACAIVGVLAFFKYGRFAAANLDALVGGHPLALPELVVPLAISFFTFEFLHVLADAYAGNVEALDPLDFAAFALFFPTLVAGPIKRYQSFVPQLRALAPPTRAAAGAALLRITSGIVKKSVIADSMDAFTGPLSAPGFPYGRLDAIVAVLAYAVKIYADFSAYSDIAIGVAALLGIRIAENFARPYGARNVAEFWRRWHISLSSWIRDYVFVPLGGSRRGRLATALNLVVAMALAGLWHGAAWTFVAWGLWHGAGLALHRAWSAAVVPRVGLLRRESAVLRYASVAATFAFVTCGWVFFAAPSLGTAAAVFARIFA